MRGATRTLGLTILYTACAAPVFVAFLQRPGNYTWVDTRPLPLMVNGTGDRPFVYRTLLPTTVRVVVATIPSAAKRALEDAASIEGPIRALFASTPAPEELAPPIYIVAYLLEFATLVGFALTLRACAKFFYPGQSLLAIVLPLIALPGLIPFFRYTSFDYDFPQLFFFTITMLMLARRRWVWFYPLLVLCGFSKETSLLLVMIHCLANADAMPRRSLLRHAAVQLLILAAIRLFLQFVAFADNPGRPVEVWVVRNWERLCDPSRWRSLFWFFIPIGRSTYRIPAATNVLCLAVIPLICWRWSRKPLFLRRALWIAPVLGVLIFVCGYIDELRAAYEAYPIVLLLAAGGFVSDDAERGTHAAPADAQP